jgi:chaperonin GroES
MTQRLWYYPYEIDELQRAKTWRDANLQISEDDSDEEKLQEFYEQHCFLDLDSDGYKEPYIVTVHKKSEEVVRIVAGYYPEDIVVRLNGTEGKFGDLAETMAQSDIDEETAMQLLMAAEFIRVPRINVFTKFAFFPAPDGSFYDVGFGQLVGPMGDSIDTINNQLIDAGTLSNRQGGFIRDGVSVSGQRGTVSFSIGEFKRITLPSQSSISDAIYQMKFPEPSIVLFNLLGSLVQAAKEITGTSEIMVGQAGQNETATGAMSRIDQGLKVFTAIYKRVYRSLKLEYKKLYELNGRFLKPEEYFKIFSIS